MVVWEYDGIATRTSLPNQVVNWLLIGSIVNIDWFNMDYWMVQLLVMVILALYFYNLFNWAADDFLEIHLTCNKVSDYSHFQVPKG